MMITPQNDIKIEKSGGEDRLNDAEKRKGKCDYCGKTGYTRENVGNSTPSYPRSRWCTFRYYEISCAYDKRLQKVLLIPCHSTVWFLKGGHASA